MTATSLDQRVVEVLCDLGPGADQRWTVGSGVFIGEGHVLTAAHAVQGGAITVRTIAKDEHTAAVVLSGIDGGVDLAVLRVASAGRNVTPSEFARVARNQPTATLIRNCWAVGFPRFQTVVEESGVQVRATAQVNGEIPVGDDLGSGMLNLLVNKSPRPLPPAEEILGNSEWSGMSGAAVFADERILGVVTEHSPRRGAQSLMITPITFVDRLEDSASWWELLRTAPDELAQLPDVANASFRRTVKCPIRLSPRPLYFVGRDALMERLRARFAQSNQGSRPQVVALCGLGGVGKTSTAVAYAHDYLADYTLVWQLTCDDPAVLTAGYADLGRQLGVHDITDAGADPMQQVHTALAARSGKWLLILDNAADFDAVHPVVPPVGRGHVIVTSRQGTWPAAQRIDVAVLEQADAVEFLLQRTASRDRDTAAVVAEELGMLPLALEQAGAFVAVGETMAGYLNLLRQHRDELFRHGDPVGYSARVATTWSVSFERLTESAPAAVDLLRMLACCAPDVIPYSLLLEAVVSTAVTLPAAVGRQIRHLASTPLAAHKAIADLGRYSLTSLPKPGFVSVHRLVQAVTLDHMADDQRQAWRVAVASMLEAALPADPLRPANWPIYGALLPHVRRVLAVDSTAMSAVARYLGTAGDYVNARILQQRIVTAIERIHGVEHPKSLTARYELARWIGTAGDPAGARDQLAALLRDRMRVLGADHPDTLAGRHGLAYWTGEAGDTASARDQAAALLPARARALGPEHRDTLSSARSLARWTGSAGNAADARDRLTALLPMHERELGAEHPDTLNCRDDLAHWTGAAGNVGRARDQLTTLLPIYERLFGVQHPKTIDIRGNLARWSGEMGDAAGARDQLTTLLPFYSEVLGMEHPKSLSTRHGLAHWTGAAGNAADAREQFNILIPIYERVLGAEHHDSLAARRSHARWTGDAGDFSVARDLLAALLPLHELVFGVDHPDSLSTRHGLAHWTGAAGDAAGACDRFAALMLTYERVLGVEHPDTLAARRSLARWKGDAGDAAGARDLLTVLLPVHERIFGVEHPDTLTVRHGLGHWTGVAEDTVGARDQFTALVHIYERVLGVEHPDTLAARHSLARWTGKAGDAESARDQLAALLPIRERTLGVDHPDTLTTSHGLASWTGRAGNATSARDQFALLVPIYERVLGDEHPDTLAARSNLARWAEVADG
jgi:hypothetical protein